jgi:predicted RNase H-like nuclease
VYIGDFDITLFLMTSFLIGVNGCPAGWISAAYTTTEDRIVWTVHNDFGHVLGYYPDDAVIAVDIPIGLTESSGRRRCERIARQLIGPRRCSVFPSPDRRVLQSQTYAEACKVSQAYTGRGLSVQSFALRTKISQVDRVITPELQSRVFEIHPEVCFWAAAGRRHLVHYKNLPAGFDDRRSILRGALKGVAIPSRIEAARMFTGVRPDDVLDSAIGAWTAWRYANGLSESVLDEPEYDSRGLRMEMVY